MEMSDRGAYVALAVAIAGVSFASIFIRWSVSHPLVKATYRMGFAALLLLPLVLVDGGRALRSVDRRDLLLLGGVGLVLALHFATWIASLDFTSVASSVILVNSHPLLVALLAALVLREPVSRRVGGAVALGFAGIVVLGLGGRGGGQDLLGNGLAFAGGVMAALYLLAGRRLRQRIALIPYVFLVYGFSALFLLVMTVGSGTDLRPTGDASRELLLFLALAAVSTLLGHTLYNWALRYVQAPLVSTSLLGEPVGATLLALILLGEAPSSLEIAGGLLALAGIYLTARALHWREASRPSG